MKRVRFVLGCHKPQLSDKAGDTFVLGLISSGVLGCVALSIFLNRAAEASAFTAVLMAIINAIKESRAQRSSERTIQQVTPTQGATS